MPTYSYKCRSCEHEWEDYYLIADRKIPESEECPLCFMPGTVYQKIGTPKLLYSVDNSLKTSDNFNSRLKEIKKRSGSGDTVGDSIR